MTKPTKTTDVSVEDTTVAEMQELANQAKRDEFYARERALDSALTLHKQNGGMIQPERILEDARKFLAFTQGA